MTDDCFGIYLPEISALIPPNRKALPNTKANLTRFEDARQWSM